MLDSEGVPAGDRHPLRIAGEIALPPIRSHLPSAFCRTLLLGAVGLCGCAGESPTGPSSPLGGYPVTVLVFYDGDGDGRRSPSENGRVPGVDVTVAGLTARSVAGSGRAVIQDVPAGTHVVSVTHLPPYYRVGQLAAGVTVPQPAELEIPLTAPIGANVASTYMAFGDSITWGTGSSDETGYRLLLEQRLRAHFAAGTVVNQGVPGGRSDRGAERIAEALQLIRPAYTLTLYGTNDWNDARCHADEPCFTVESLRSVVRQTWAASSLPILATIPPVNPSLNSPLRNSWVDETNAKIRLMAAEENTVVADIHAAFWAHPPIEGLFSDHIHPNDAGYLIMANELFRAITEPAPGQPQSFLCVPLDPFDAPWFRDFSPQRRAGTRCYPVQR
jgi:acyl-CoA thioesterase I